MFSKICILLFFVSIITSAVHAKDIDVTTYCVKGDSTTLNSTGIQKAIDECSTVEEVRLFFLQGNIYQEPSH